jgi:hypothetical protein
METPMRRYGIVEDGDAIVLHHGDLWRARCCDCGLVHEFDVRQDGEHVVLIARRNERRTAASRRAKTPGMLKPAVASALGYKMVKCKRSR